jgi:anti-sigma regulatory factor (Ser/Thr protein kinase)
MTSVTVPVTESSQIGEARRAAMRMAETTALSETERGQVAIIATELATNLARYARNGRIVLRPPQGAKDDQIQLLAIDSGPGITDLAKCFEDGFSTGGGAGVGMGAVRRLSAEFDIFSAVDSGTVVWSRVATKRAQRAQETIRWAAISTPAPGEHVCGDAWRVCTNGAEVGVTVIDGLGHGPLAAEAAVRAAGVFDDAVCEQPLAFCERAHKALAGTRGAAIAAAYLTRNGVLRYAGVGNICGTLVSAGQSRGLFSQNGTAGAQMRRMQQIDYEWPQGGVLVMHSDGLTNRWSLGRYPGLIARHPAVIAGVLHRDFTRGKDDATVVVVKRAAGK